jgi:DNA invertase Pin-like site-specific DNA recombinase
MAAKDKTPPAYSYIRFSDPKQCEGDSLRRQVEATEAWCLKNGVTLDAGVSLRDLGTSAFTGAHRKNPDRHALASFLKLVESGKVPRGSFLVVENLDRLTREHVRAAVTLFLSILEQGVSIVTTSPERVFRHDSEDMTDVIIAVVDLARGHGESKRKSDMVGANWQKRRGLARAQGRRLPGRLPAWVEEGPDGKPRLLPRRAAVVHRIYQLAAQGYGLGRIVKRLTDDKVPSFGPAGRWVRGYVGLLLRDRRTVGEYQPRTGRGHRREKDGDAIAGFFPAVVTEAEWNAARAGAAERRTKPGRIGKHVNLWTGILKDAHSGEPYYPFTRNRDQARVFVRRGRLEGTGPARTFPVDVFERAVLGLLKEIDPHEILNGDSGPDESQVLAGELARVEASIALIVAEMDAHGENPVLFKRLRDKTGRQRDLNEQLAAARLKAAHPLSETWGECPSLIDALDGAPDREEARTRLRSTLRRMIESVRLLVVSRGQIRIAAVQIWFAGGKKHRDYVVVHRPPRANGRGYSKGRTAVCSLAAVAKAGDLNLRRAEDAAALEQLLLAQDVGELWAKMG